MQEQNEANPYDRNSRFVGNIRALRAGKQSSQSKTTKALMLKKNNDESSEFQSELDENNKLLQEYYNDQMQR